MQKIPPKFVEKFGDGLSDVARLRVPNGSVWRVELTRYGRKIWFGDGWDDFVKYHSICAGHFLVFKYAKNSTFNVLIFDATACEIDYPYNYGEPKVEEQRSIYGDEMENEDSIKILGAPTPDKNAMYNSQGSLYRKRHRSETANNFIAASPSVQDMEVKIGRPKFQTAVNTWEDEQQTEVADGNELWNLLEEMGISISRSCRFLTVKERHRAMSVARLFKPKNPSFMVIMQEDVKRRGFLYIPTKFSNKYLGKVGEVIKVQVSDGREWPLHTRFNNHMALYLSRGWTRFSNEMNLEKGDICIFELISMEDFHLKVSVSYASTE